MNLGDSQLPWSTARVPPLDRAHTYPRFSPGQGISCYLIKY